MCAEMLAQECVPTEGLRTHVTLMRLRARMGPDVQVIHGLLTEPLLAPLTLILLCNLMDLEMTAQVALVTEGPSTDGAGGGKLVGPLMPGLVIAEIPELANLLPAFLTLVLFLTFHFGSVSRG